MKIIRHVPGTLLAVVLALATASAQTQMVRPDFFPADLEFKEIQSVRQEDGFKDAARIARVRDGIYINDAGFEQYHQRAYSLQGGGTLSIEVVKLKDTKGAYSLLTLLRKGGLESGPPGEFHAIDGGALLFARGEYFVRILADGGVTDLPKRVGTSVSNRIGQRISALPQLVSHVPKAGCDASSLRYFLGPKSYAAFSMAGQNQLKFEAGMEIAEVRCTANSQTGLLTLVSFPTHEMAEGYQQALESAVPGNAGMFVKRAGPLLGVLTGSFDPGTADSLLGSVHFTYAIKWIYDKNNHRNAGKTIWGVPMPILGTVVRSILLVGILCGMSILVGVSFAFFRVWLRDFAPQNILDRPDRTEMTRLKIDEK